MLGRCHLCNASDIQSHNTRNAADVVLLSITATLKFGSKSIRDSERDGTLGKPTSCVFEEQILTNCKSCFHMSDQGNMTADDLSHATNPVAL